MKSQLTQFYAAHFAVAAANHNDEDVKLTLDYADWAEETIHRDEVMNGRTYPVHTK